MMYENAHTESGADLLPHVVRVAPVGSRPLIRYPGGKKWLAPVLRAGLARWLSAHPLGAYVEPFFGGGSVGLDLGFQNTLAGDFSAHLIDCYRSVSAAPDAVAYVVEQLAAVTPADDLDRRVRRGARDVPGPYYYAVRDAYNAARANTAALGESFAGEGGSSAERAAMFLYLMARCFNGVLREDRRGRYNVPVGDVRAPRYLSRDRLLEFAAVTSAWRWHLGDFAATIEAAPDGSAIFADPPYAGTWTGYTAAGFGPAEQERLADALARARDRGCAVAHTNADVVEVRSMYAARGFSAVPTAEPRAVSRSGTGRGRARCLLVLSHADLIEIPEDSPAPLARNEQGGGQVEMFGTKKKP